MDDRTPAGIGLADTPTPSPPGDEREARIEGHPLGARVVARYFDDDATLLRLLRDRLSAIGVARRRQPSERK